jgi:hypothetical protein
MTSPDLYQVAPSSYGRANFAGGVSYTPRQEPIGADVYIDWERGNRQTVTLTQDTNIYFVNPFNGTFHLLVEQQGDWVVTWKFNDTGLPTVAWVDGANPVVTTGGSEAAPVYDTFSFSDWEDKRVYVGMMTQNCTVPTE